MLGGPFLEHGEAAGGAELLDLVEGDGQLAGHVALEDDGAAGGAFEVAGELVAVGEDEDVGLLGLGERGGGEEESESEGVAVRSERKVGLQSGFLR